MLQSEPSRTRFDVRRDIFQSIHQHQDVALLAPRHRGKREFLGEIHKALQEQKAYGITAAPESVFLNLNTPQDGGEPVEWDLRALVRALLNRGRPELDGVVESTATTVFEALRELLVAAPGKLVLLVTPIEALSDDLARDFLISVRSLPPDLITRIVLVVGGSHSLEALSDKTENSPFNTAVQMELPPLSLPECHAVVAELGLVENAFPVLSEAETERLWEMTGGEPALIRILGTRLGSAPLGHPPTLDQVIQSVISDVCSSVSTGHRESGSGLGVLLSILDQIAANPSWLLLVAGCLQRTPPLREHFFRRSPAMCVAFRREGHSYGLSCHFFEQLLERYFSDRRIADSLVLCGEWGRAKPFYLRATGEAPVQLLWGRERSLTEVTFFAFERVAPGALPRRVIAETLDIARLVIGAEVAALWSARFEGTEWLRRRLHDPRVNPDDPSAPPEVIEQMDAVVKLALRRRRLADGGAGHVVAAHSARADTGELVVLCVASAGQPIHDAQKLAVRALVRECASALSEAELRLRLEREKQEQKRRLDVATSLTRTLQEHLDVKRTATKLLEVLVELGYPLAIISLLDHRTNTVRGLSGSPPLATLVAATERVMGGKEIAPQDDILAFTIKTGERQHLDDCNSPDSRCDYAALALPDPHVASQIVFPLKAARGVGWLGGQVFGTLQLINPPHVHPDQAESEVIEEVVAHASVALANAILFEERERLVGQMAGQLRLLEDSAAALAQVHDVDGSLHTMLEAAVRLVGGVSGSIRLCDPNYDRLVYRTCVGPEGSWTLKLIREEYVKDDSSTAGWVYRHEKSRINLDTSHISEGYRPVFAWVRSNVGVLIKATGRLLGVMVIDSDQRDAFTEAHVKVLEATGAIIGALIKAGEDYRLERTRAELAPILSSRLIWNERLEKAVATIREVVRCDFVSLFLRSEKDNDQYVLSATTADRLREQVGTGSYRIGQGGTGWVLKYQRPLRVRGRMLDRERWADIHRDLEFQLHLQEFPVDDPERARIDFLAFPLINKDGCVGVIRCIRLVEPDRPETLFSSYDEQVLQVAVEHLTNALDRRQLEQDRDAKAQALEIATGTVAHRIKNPAFGIAGRVLSLRRQLDDLPESLRASAAHDLDNIDQRVKRIEAIVKGFAELASPTRHQLERVDLVSLLQEVHRTNSLTDATHVLRLNAHAIASAPVLVDPEALRSVLEELIGNAFRVMPEQGEVLLDLTGPLSPHTPPFPKLAVPFFLITVSDTGPGIEPEVRQRIFEPFFTTRASGSGLGLAMVKKHSDDMGIALLQDAEPGSGARFRLGIPAAELAPE